MKKFISVFAVVLLFAFTTQAQHTVPRFGTGSGNNGQNLTYTYVTAGDATGNDTLLLKPGAWVTIYQPTVVDSFSYKLSSLNGSYVGDHIIFVFKNTSGIHKVKFVGTLWTFGSATSTVTLASSKKATIEFVFDGITWVEVCRMIGT